MVKELLDKFLTGSDQDKDVPRQEAHANLMDDYPTVDLIQQLKQAMDLSKTHTQLFRDILDNADLNQLAEGPAHELLSELEQMQKLISILIQQATNKDSPEVQNLLGQAFETLDSINAAISLHSELCVQKGGERQCQPGTLLGRNASGDVPARDGARSFPMAARPSPDDGQSQQKATTDPFGLDQLEQGLHNPFADLDFQPAQVITRSLLLPSLTGKLWSGHCAH